MFNVNRKRIILLSSSFEFAFCIPFRTSLYLLRSLKAGVLIGFLLKVFTLFEPIFVSKDIPFLSYLAMDTRIFRPLKLYPSRSLMAANASSLLQKRTKPNAAVDFFRAFLDMNISTIFLFVEKRFLRQTLERSSGRPSTNTKVQTPLNQLPNADDGGSRGPHLHGRRVNPRLPTHRSEEWRRAAAVGVADRRCCEFPWLT